VAHRLKVGDGLAELPAFDGVAQRQVERAAGDAAAEGTDHDPFEVEEFEDERKAVALFAQHRGGGSRTSSRNTSHVCVA
jgi:hypothetical protein